MIRSSNPVLSEKTFQSRIAEFGGVGVMTVKGTINKTIVMALLVAGTAAWSWMNPSNVWMMVGLIGGLIMALVTAFRPRSAGYTAPLYAVFEGLFLGTISAYFNASYGGIVFQAVSLTIGVLFTMLFLYRSGIIKVTEKFRMGVFAATGGIFLMYMLNLILSFFGAQFLYLENASLLMIGISVAVVVIAALNLVLDFDFIDRASASGAPKYMEWYGAFGLMVTLIWLYFEILRLLAMLNRR